MDYFISCRSASLKGIREWDLHNTVLSLKNVNKTNTSIYCASFMLRWSICSSVSIAGWIDEENFASFAPSDESSNEEYAFVQGLLKSVPHFENMGIPHVGNK